MNLTMIVKGKNIEPNQIIEGIVLFVILSFISQGFWFAIIASGFGAQSLTNIFEIPTVLVLTAFSTYFMRRRKFYKVILVLLVIVFLLRVFMPVLTE